jgi:hypothetical protein
MVWDNHSLLDIVKIYETMARSIEQRRNRRQPFEYMCGKPWFASMEQLQGMIVSHVLPQAASFSLSSKLEFDKRI